ncbi:uncharacterized protein LOC129757716 [Uranotaenia lowii]|uniref:uncharacterized protein LOC129757716 n=1 Tax=Uranotaenia lowii TaxID=190385 RepID=UPI002479EAE8|nr:uncharacterized protein LOC129757716 [Uranotaenia lowii]
MGSVSCPRQAIPPDDQISPSFETNSPGQGYKSKQDFSRILGCDMVTAKADSQGLHLRQTEELRCQPTEPYHCRQSVAEERVSRRLSTGNCPVLSRPTRVAGSEQGLPVFPTVGGRDRSA